MDIVKFYRNPQFPRFLAFSGIAALANMGVGYLLYELAGLKQGWKYGLSVAVAFLAGMGVSFTLNRRFTFAPSGRAIHEEVRTFFIVSAGGLILTVSLASLFRTSIVPELVSLPVIADHTPQGLTVEMISHFVAVGLVAFYSFACHKLFSFGKGIRYYLPGESKSAGIR